MVSEGVGRVMIGGDINYEATRTSEHAIIIKTWLLKMDLISVWNNYPIDFTHHHIDFSSVAILDHFFVTSDLLNVVKSAGVYHHAEQFSRHDPIWVTFDFDVLRTRGKKGVNRRKPGWDKASFEDINNYRTMLGVRLEMMNNGD